MNLRPEEISSVIKEHISSGLKFMERIHLLNKFCDQRTD